MKKELIIKSLQDKWKESIYRIKTKEAEKLGLDTSKKEIKIGNFILKKNLILPDYSINIIDDDKDLDNLPYSENIKAFRHFEDLFKDKKFKINSDELKDFNINTNLNSIIFNNIKIVSLGGLFGNFRIELNNPEKGPDGKWLDSSIDLNKIFQCLNDYKISKRKYKELSEVSINKDLEKHFKNYFENVARSTGNLTSLYDLIIGKLKGEKSFVIEIKLASTIKMASKKHEASGQMKHYIEEFKNKNFILLIIGNIEDKQDKNVVSLQSEVQKDFKCHYYFLDTQ